jgi:hypothetical protein
MATEALFGAPFLLRRYDDGTQNRTLCSRNWLCKAIEIDPDMVVPGATSNKKRIKIIPRNRGGERESAKWIAKFIATTTGDVLLCEIQRRQKRLKTFTKRLGKD